MSFLRSFCRLQAKIVKTLFPEKCVGTGFFFSVSLGDSQGVTEEPSHRGGVGYIVPCCRFCVFSALGYETFWLLAASGGFLVARGGEKSRTLVLFWASWCPQAAKSLVP